MITFILKCIGRFWIYMDNNSGYWAAGMRKKGRVWRLKRGKRYNSRIE